MHSFASRYSPVRLRAYTGEIDMKVATRCAVLLGMIGTLVIVTTVSAAPDPAPAGGSGSSAACSGAGCVTTGEVRKPKVQIEPNPCEHRAVAAGGAGTQGQTAGQDKANCEKKPQKP